MGRPSFSLRPAPSNPLALRNPRRTIRTMRHVDAGRPEPLMRLQGSRLARSGMRWANRWLGPLANLPISVRGHRLHPRTFDRRLAAELARWSRSTAGMLDLWRERCRPGTIALDIGANLGLYTLEASDAVGPSGEVLAVEPAPENADSIARAVAGSGRRNIRLLRAAAVDRTGPIALGLRGDHGGDHRVLVEDDRRTMIEVEGLRLDEAIDANREVSAIKLDVQGAEGLALAGLVETLDRSTSLSILMEFWPDGLRRLGTDPKTLIHELATRGYVPSVFQPRSGRLESVGDADALVEHSRRRGFTDLLFARAKP